MLIDAHCVPSIQQHHGIDTPITPFHRGCNQGIDKLMLCMLVLNLFSSFLVAMTIIYLSYLFRSSMVFPWHNVEP